MATVRQSLVHFPEVCLARSGKCEACHEACRPAALTVTGDGCEVSKACTQCGNCVAACPTGALALKAFDAAGLRSRGGAARSVECRCVPAELRLKDALVVPCLGARDAPALLRLAKLAGERPLELIDRAFASRLRRARSQRRGVGWPVPDGS
jgi:ferredoxin